MKGFILDLYWVIEKKIETTVVYWAYIGTMENGNYCLGFGV